MAIEPPDRAPARRPETLLSEETLVLVDADDSARDHEEMQDAARLGVYVAPVIVVHVALVWWLIRAATGLRLPAWLHADQIMAWLYINGGIVAIAAWTWRRRRAPLRRRLWLRGPRARLLILFWLGGSLAWFLLPAVLGDMWAAFRAWLGGW